MRRIYAYYKKFGHSTIVMPASWRPSRPGEELDEILALAGVDRMTIPPKFIDMLAASDAPVPRQLDPTSAGANPSPHPAHSQHPRCVADSFAVHL